MLTQYEITKQIYNTFLPTGCSDKPEPTDNYDEAFDLIQRLDKESTYHFDDMMKYADRLNKEGLSKLEDAIGELQESIQDSRVEVQKRIMDIYKIIAMEDGQ